MIILDTDHITLLQQGGQHGGKIRDRLRLLDLSHHPPTSIVTYDEQVRGWIARFSAAKTIADDVRLYAKLSEQLIFYGTLRIFDFSELAAVEFQRLRALKVRVGTMDLRIASIAIANRATLWSRNVVDFQKVPGLNVKDATI